MLGKNLAQNIHNMNKHIENRYMKSEKKILKQRKFINDHRAIMERWIISH